jgi:hypothetical protein
MPAIGEILLSVSSISPTTVSNTGNVSLIINFSIVGDGLSLPGYAINLYDSLTGGTIVKQLYYSDSDDIISGYATTVSFSGVSSGTYYVELYYKTTGTPRKQIVVTGTTTTQNINLNGTKITSYTLNGSSISTENLNGVIVYES